MAKQDKDKLKFWFRTGKFPTQEQFWDWMDSYIHRDDQLRIGANFPELDGVLQQKVDKEVFKYHLENENNPHKVTKQQVGLSNADNTADVDKPISKATQSALNLKVDQTTLIQHTNDHNNPHCVNKEQVGLAKVDNTADMDKPISNAIGIALYQKADYKHVHDVKTLTGFDKDVTLAANSDEKIASQKAVKTYVDAATSTLQTQIANALLIPGMIIAWKGATDTIPTGWELCNELKDKFILGAGSDFEVGTTGGTRVHQLTVDEMPSHRHQLNDMIVPNTASERGLLNKGDLAKSEIILSNTGSTGGNQPHNNMPPYYVLAYIEYVGVAKSTNTISV